MEMVLYGENKCMVGLFLIDSLWLSFQVWPMLFYLLHHVLTLCESRELHKHG